MTKRSFCVPRSLNRNIFEQFFFSFLFNKLFLEFISTLDKFSYKFFRSVLIFYYIKFPNWLPNISEIDILYSFKGIQKSKQNPDWQLLIMFWIVLLFLNLLLRPIVSTLATLMLKGISNWDLFIIFCLSSILLYITYSAI